MVKTTGKVDKKNYKKTVSQRYRKVKTTLFFFYLHIVIFYLGIVLQQMKKQVLQYEQYMNEKNNAWIKKPNRIQFYVYFSIFLLFTCHIPDILH